MVITNKYANGANFSRCKEHGPEDQNLLTDLALTAEQVQMLDQIKVESDAADCES